MNENAMRSGPTRRRGLGKSFARGIGIGTRFFWKLSVVLCFVAFGLLVGGFLQFSATVTGYDMPAEPAASDGVVVLTGGTNRIAKALDLMDRKKGQRLLISGVNKTTRDAEIRSINPNHSQVFDCCVDYGREALDTIGNAQEGAAWAAKHKYKSVTIVTSGYHMPRALVEFRRLMPEVKLNAYPIPLEELKQDGWWRKSGPLRLVLSEYLKYVGANFRVYFRPATLNALRGNPQES